MDYTFIRDTLRFWDTFPDERKTGEAAKKLEAEIRVAVEKMDVKTCVQFAEISRRQYAEQEATKSSVASRASALLLFVGVISTGTTVVAGSLTTVQPLFLAFVVGIGACLLYACLAVAVLAVRAQEVAMWTAPAIYADDAQSSRSLTVKDAVEHAFSYSQNKTGVRHLVAYLADAQRWARRAVILVVCLALLSVLAAATKAPAPNNPIASPGPQATASPAPLPAATAVPAPSPRASPSLASQPPSGLPVAP